jgi:hypothetical protein
MPGGYISDMPFTPNKNIPTIDDYIRENKQLRKELQLLKLEIQREKNKLIQHSDNDSQYRFTNIFTDMLDFLQNSLIN